MICIASVVACNGSGKGDVPLIFAAASLAVSSIAILNGADIVRVHDINNSKKIFSIIDSIIRE